MTLIKIDLRNPALNGADLGAAGYVELSPTARRHTDGTPDWVTLPTPVFVYLGVAYVGTGTTEAPQFPAVGGVAYVDLAPTLTGESGWKSVERVKRGIVRYVAVPNAVGPIDYGDLADVDPDTLNPTTPVIPAYQALFALKQDIATLEAFMADKLDNPSGVVPTALGGKIAKLKAWAKNPDQLIAGAVTLDANDLVTSAVVEWPDGTPGVLTIDSRQAVTNAIIAYHITYVAATTLTYTQPAITRNANGAAVLVPQITVA